MVSFASRQRENWRIVLPITISEVTTQNPYFGLKHTGELFLNIKKTVHVIAPRQTRNIFIHFKITFIRNFWKRMRANEYSAVNQNINFL